MGVWLNRDIVEFSGDGSPQVSRYQVAGSSPGSRLDP